MNPLLLILHLTGCTGPETTIRDLEPELVVLPEALDFGEVVAGETSTLALTLTNDGRDLLQLSGGALSDGTAGVFTFTLDPLDLDIDAATTLEVSFTPTAFATYADTLALSWNHDEDSPTLVPLLGTGVDIDRPDIESDPAECLDFGLVAPGETATEILRIRNTGEDDLLIEDTQLTGSGAFTLQPDLDGLTVSAGGVSTTIVTYAPTSGDGDSATYTITSNDPDESPFEICLIGNGGGEGNYPVATLVCPDDTTPMSTVSFDGSGSNDPGGAEPLTYAWSLSGAPTGSVSTLESDGGTSNALYLDVAGDYTVSLIVTNSLGVPSAPAECDVAAIPTEDIRVELSWDTDESDLDLHLADGTAALYDVPGDLSWCNETPDWGEEGLSEDDPLRTQDDEDGYGPESIEIVEAANGEYRVRVHYYEDEGGGATTATVKFYIYGSLAEEVSYTLSRNEVWEVGWVLWDRGYVIIDEEPAPLDAERRSCPG